ncbi:MAG: hypothetical protein DRJ49_01135 [Thermoprotei archaeon]|nr:MAG: hypothetical protein DRJ49_01135 [Thermoprotei archaeon]
MKRTIALVLCGGEGTRLRPLTFYFQKTMLPIGINQKPLLEYIVRLLSYHRIKHIVMLVGYKYKQIINYFENGSRFGVNIVYVCDDPNLPGTGGALLNAFKQGAFNLEDTLLIYYGDILSNINITEMLNTHHRMKAACTVALAKGYRVRVGVAEVKNGRIVKLIEKPSLDLPVTIGILAIEGWTLELLQEKGLLKKSMDIMGDIIPELIKRGYTVIPYITSAFWYDIGSTERYEKLNHVEVDRIFEFLFRKV